MNRIEHWKKNYSNIKQELLNNYFTLLKFESISADSKYHSEGRSCANWIRDFLSKIGFQIEMWETDRNPVLFASSQIDPKAKTVLIYHHYDVQPVDPIELWKSPPFEPKIVDQNVYARGAQDNKGQCIYTLMALKALYEENKRYPLNIKLCIEGEEEIGSPGLAKLVFEKQKSLSADYLVIVDSGMSGPDSPEICLGARGIICMDVTATGSHMDLHSGQHGGAAYNPLHALVEVLAALRDPKTGKVTVPHFYDEVGEINEEEKQLFKIPFDENTYIAQTGAKPTGGEKHLPPTDRTRFRPTLEINGIQGGYAGEGFKTVIPAQAMAKISCRLVPNQDPETIAKQVKDYILSLAPKGITLQVKVHPGSGSATRAKLGSNVVKAFEEAYKEVFQKPTKNTLMGGSVPITSSLAKVSGGDLVLVGLGLPTDAIHAPNEHFGIDRLEKGFCLMIRSLEILSKT